MDSAVPPGDRLRLQRITPPTGRVPQPVPEAGQTQPLTYPAAQAPVVDRPDRPGASAEMAVRVPSGPQPIVSHRATPALAASGGRRFAAWLLWLGVWALAATAAVNAYNAVLSGSLAWVWLWEAAAVAPIVIALYVTHPARRKP